MLIFAEHTHVCGAHSPRMCCTADAWQHLPRTALSLRVLQGVCMCDHGTYDALVWMHWAGASLAMHHSTLWKAVSGTHHAHGNPHAHGYIFSTHTCRPMRMPLGSFPASCWMPLRKASSRLVQGVGSVSLNAGLGYCPSDSTPTCRGSDSAPETGLRCCMSTPSTISAASVYPRL